jgi:high-affinity iron transporter
MAPLVVHLLDYISVDYPEFVKDGKVLDQGEYKEQQEFAAQIIELIAALPAVPARPVLLEQAAALKDLIDAKAQGTEVSSAATALRWRVVEAYGIAVAPKSPPDLPGAASLYSARCAALSRRGGKGRRSRGEGTRPRAFELP